MEPSVPENITLLGFVGDDDKSLSCYQFNHLFEIRLRQIGTCQVGRVDPKLGQNICSLALCFL